jgi:hypothetical protein
MRRPQAEMDMSLIKSLGPEGKAPALEDVVHLPLLMTRSGRLARRDRAIAREFRAPLGALPDFLMQILA